MGNHALEKRLRPLIYILQKCLEDQKLEYLATLRILSRDSECISQILSVVVKECHLLSVCVFVAWSCLTLCDPMDCIPPGSSVTCHINQQRMLGPSSQEPLQLPLCALSGFRVEKSRMMALDSEGAYQRNSFNEPGFLHLPIHRKALNSLT